MLMRNGSECKCTTTDLNDTSSKKYEYLAFGPKDDLANGLGKSICGGWALLGSGRPRSTKHEVPLRHIRVYEVLRTYKMSNLVLLLVRPSSYMWHLIPM